MMCPSPRRPRWWPENEPWPPRRHLRAPLFVRRLGCLFTGLIALTVLLLARSQQVFAAIAIVAALTLAFAFILSRVSRRLRAEDRLRRQLMADVAHELRTPLAILQGRIEGLLDGVYARDDNRIGELLDETKHLSRLVEDLRTFANAEAGALELRKEPTDIGELIRDTAASFDAPIAVDIPDELPVISVDPLRIREVLLNVVSNAIDHATDVSIAADADSRRVLIRVSDRGPGIPAAALPDIFERFTKRPGSRGTGLGLAISRNLVVAHGGTIAATSREGEGTTVTVTLPR